MDKSKVIALFGSAAKTAAALRVSRSAISQWPDSLPPRIADRVIAGAVRNGINLPPDLLGRLMPEQKAA